MFNESLAEDIVGTLKSKKIQENLEKSNTLYSLKCLMRVIGRIKMRESNSQETGMMMAVNLNVSHENCE